MPKRTKGISIYNELIFKIKNMRRVRFVTFELLDIF